ncbi:trypsin-like serine protease [Rhodococcus sp. NPDC058532]|uniref:trypsin-like serine protease n=1 Tax=Rhodococcus sp. NPDC058532 TaxID=3346540 RepID=UPI003654F102
MFTSRLFAAGAAGFALATLGPVGTAHALHSDTFAADNAESAAVVSAQIADTGSLDGDCTGTAIAPHWVLTARHCIEPFPTPGGSVRLGQGDQQRRVQVDHWEAAPAGDIALLHTVEDMGLASYPTVSDTVPGVGAARLYGWSPDGSGKTTKLPVAEGEITELLDMSLFEGKQMINVDTHNGGKTQPGDSGGPLFVDGKVVGTLSASLGDDKDGMSDVAAYAVVAEQYDWVMETIGGRQGANAGTSGGGDLNAAWLVGGGGGMLVAIGASVMVLRGRGKSDAG